ncbi:MAG: hypothetical protein A4S09_06095 [Proteobacteria bacterium SG_bin7]|nr:MAG: hypothetical protein A4S09_06095 [Proteobacteria bacterium SG_bin7]
MQLLKLFSKGTGYIGLLVLAGCPLKEDVANRSISNSGVKDLIAKGKITYSSSCTACHNPDPKKPGSIGPEVYGSTRELLEARVLRAEYPQGYKPKRATKSMAALPHLKNDIDALAAYLNN